MNPRATLLLASAAALLAGCSGSGTGKAKSELIAADIAFSEMSAKVGPSAALLAFIAPDAKLLSVVRQGKDGVHDELMQLPPTATLTWTTSYADVAASGDLGYTWGRYTLIVPSSVKGRQPLVEKGTYVTVWRHQAIGGWKVVLDGGNPDGRK
jgi:ketosteroid isomerase-like protein